MEANNITYIFLSERRYSPLLLKRKFIKQKADYRAQQGKRIKKETNSKILSGTKYSPTVLWI